ncbi:hypothetical protein EMIHUDRAFT_220510 [Emiliania huxleyi CCMP1516]|uniref:PNPLA domain-containing protein n=2 Tax=Emiliania huxleyi TaxID=2903 RepID=A0A0D3I187_EMIH1|nr:hypothetical protein EMIHUDRAFT_220510 [Emiliania huxleyi CCMP1516]EOD05022.1 hypothetical protein EMIHUDRAFT_220510 [Emiliania huxleyi CCMP1516]|eukprot:XP_005757451.1 hypothetical protein EMIHUDRAFT_220510 [Emiliania huxleyi CCMP1516]
MWRSLLAAPRLSTPAPPPAAAAARRGLRALVARSRKDVPEGEAASSLVDVAAVSALPRQDPKARDIEHSSIYRWCRASPFIHAAVRVARIDYAGVVARSSSPLWREGDAAGQYFDGGYAERATLPSSDEPCWLVAGDEVEEPIGASQRLPTTAVRPRAQGWKASFLAFLASVQTSQSIRQARSDPNFCSPHGRASRRSVVMQHKTRQLKDSAVSVRARTNCNSPYCDSRVMAKPKTQWPKSSAAMPFVAPAEARWYRS